MNVKPRFGWGGPEGAKRAREQLEHTYTPFKIQYNATAPEADKPTRVASWDVEKQVNGGKVFPTTLQNIGSCVGHGLFNVLWRLSAWEIVRLGQPEQLVMPYLPFMYGISRVQVGAKHGVDFERGARTWEDAVSGSFGAYAAEAVRDYGVLRSDHPGLARWEEPKQTQYGQTLSWPGKVDGQWARKPGPPKEIMEVAKPHLIRSIAELKTGDQVMEALLNGYFVTIAWMWASDMTLVYDQTMKRHFYKRGQVAGGHQTCLIAADNDPRRPCVYDLNSWGADIHGPQEDGPPGGGWRDLEWIDRIARDNGTECFALSQFDGYPAQRPPYLLG